VLVVALAVVVGCNEKPKPPKAPTTEPVQAAAAPGAPAPDAAAGTEIAQKTCPVTGDPIDPKVYTDYNERRVYFCCSACEAPFKKDPAKYLKIVDDQIKAAATK
jgi:YHS domain-containing protein